MAQHWESRPRYVLSQVIEEVVSNGNHLRGTVSVLAIRQLCYVCLQGLLSFVPLQVSLDQPSTVFSAQHHMLAFTFCHLLS